MTLPRGTAVWYRNRVTSDEVSGVVLRRISGSRIYEVGVFTANGYRVRRACLRGQRESGSSRDTIRVMWPVNLPVSSQGPAEALLESVPEARAKRHAIAKD